MAARPERRLEVVDDPLAVGAAPHTASPATEKRDHSAVPAPDPNAATTSQRRPAASARRRQTAAASTEAQAQPLWEPPALDEQLALLAARVPASLERALERHAAQLREEEGGSSQKRLPKQDVLAALLWAAGDPTDATAQQRLRDLYRQYRSRRLAAAARRLEQG